MAAHDHPRSSGAFVCHRERTYREHNNYSNDYSIIRSVAIAVVAVAFLAACGGTTAKPTADDAATIAAAKSGPTTGAGTATSRTPAASAAAIPASGSRSFGGLLTPVTGAATSGGTRPAASAARSTGAASGTVSTGSMSAASPALNPCVLLTPAEISTVMGEPFSQADNSDESPVSNLRGYSSAACIFAPTGSAQDATRSMQIGTIRRTPATSAPTGSGTFRTVAEVWSFLSQQVQQQMTGSPSVVMGVGDEAFAVSDDKNPGDEDVYVRKGEIVLLVIVSGYDTGARDKAIAIAKQAVRRL